MRALLAAAILLAACTGGQPTAASASPKSPSSPAGAAVATPTQIALAAVPPSGAARLEGGCGTTEVYQGGELPDWATINAPKLPYVVASPGITMGYLFSYPLKAGPLGNKILWYVATPRGGYPLEAAGHPVGAAEPIARFSKAADSWPGEIYPSGPTVPSAGCWHFTMTWQGGAQRAEVDLLFK